MAAATAAAATAATAAEPSGRFRRRAITGTIRRAKHRKLNRVPLPRALRAGNLLRLVQHNLLKVRLAILANVFVYWHEQIITPLRSVSIAHLDDNPGRERHAKTPEEKGTSRPTFSQRGGQENKSPSKRAQPIQDHPVSRRGSRKRLPVRMEALEQETGS